MPSPELNLTAAIARDRAATVQNAKHDYSVTMAVDYFNNHIDRVARRGEFSFIVPAMWWNDLPRDVRDIVRQKLTEAGFLCRTIGFIGTRRLMVSW